MDERNVAEEIKDCSLDDLELIEETQKDLYTEEEMKIISERLAELREEERREKAARKAAADAWISEHLPKEIKCPKCEGPNPFSNDHCEFCGYKLDKSEYYSMEYYENLRASHALDDNQAAENVPMDSDKSYGFQYFASFLVPLVGFILGAILMGKDDAGDRSAGKACVMLGVISMVLSFFVCLAIL